jgi:hypothetical protein
MKTLNELLETINMNRNEKLKYIEEIFKICKTDSILIINSKGEFERINCPFLVRVIIPVPPLIEGDVESVTAVKLSIELIDVYIIRGRAYYFFNFSIIF